MSSEMRPFVHLHVHSEFSLCDSLIRVQDLAETVAELGMPAVALTDLCNLFALVKFYRALRRVGVKPIVGAELWIERGFEQPVRVVVLCRNAQGYANLRRLISRSYLEGRDRERAVVHVAWLRQHSAGLLLLSGGREGDVGRALLAGNSDQALQMAREWQQQFEGAYYLELQRTGHEHEERLVQQSLQLAAALDLPVVATNSVCFLRESDFAAHEIRVCIHDGYTQNDPRRPKHYRSGQYLRSPAEMNALFADCPEALDNSMAIAQRCNVEIELGQSVLPEFPVPEGMTIDAFFRQQAIEGLDVRLQSLQVSDPESYRARLQIELDVICQMGFPGYFLIVADFIRWARHNNVPVGPGRGSGAGSLVAYALQITDLDPLAYDLLFERFLNPERVSMPDFDIDFCMEGRDRVIDYVAAHYGRERVAQIATHGTMAAKAVVRDVGRALGQPYGFVDRIAKLVPFAVGMTLEKAMSEEAELQRLYDDEEDVHQLLDLAMKLEGLARNVGRHAGGVVIAPSNITDFSPLYREPDTESVVTQFDKNDIESVGLVKFDFLGLRTLTIIDWTLQQINVRRTARHELPLAIEQVALDDQASFELLKRCETTAVFQLESRGMKDLIRRLQPDCFEDIIALVALYRPGPLQSGMVDDFINRKHGRAEVVYPHPDLELILKPTYGVILYQEQVMQIAQVLAGYSLGGADLLRRAMGKKKPEEMAKQRQIFMDGAVARGVDPDTATSIFDLMEKFAGYGFNKSHSAAYALVSYHTMWLKQHYPAEFMAAALSSDMDKTDKVVILIDECRRMRLTIQPPSINDSGVRFSVDQHGDILYGLGAIKGAGEAALNHLLTLRKQAGPFSSLDDLCQRLDNARINRKMLETLIHAGALDCLNQPRDALAAQLEPALRRAEQCARAAASGQIDIFGFGEAAVPVPEVEAVPHESWSEALRLQHEKRTLGLYLTGHPIEVWRDELAHFSRSLRSISELSPAVSGRRQGGAEQNLAVVAGLATAIRTKKSSRGRMAFVTLDDGSSQLEVRLFGEVFEHYEALLKEDRLLVVGGRSSYDDYAETVRFTAEEVLTLEQARARHARCLQLSLNNTLLQSEDSDHLLELLASFRSDSGCRLHMYYQNAEAEVKLSCGASWRIVPDESLIEELKKKLGDSGVVLHYSA